MDTFWGTIRFELAQSNKIHLLWCAALLLTMLILAILHHRWRYYTDLMKRWRDLCFIPLLITTIHYFIYVTGAPHFLSNYTPLYLIALLALLTMLCAERKTGYKVFAAITVTLSVIFSAYFCVSSLNCHNYSRKSYTASFRALVKEMDHSYVLKEWKEVDFKALEDKYTPMVREAENNGDPAEFADAVTMFCNELHDSHVTVHTDYNTEKYHSLFELNDYGLSMVRLDNCDVIAVCTNAAANSLGIEDVTVITKWNGKPVLKAAAEDVPDNGVPVKENADRMALADLSGTGSETVEVSFIDKSGKEKNAVLTAHEDEHTLDDCCDAFLHRPDNEYEVLSSNFSTKMLDEKCGYIMLTAETTGSDLRDKIAYYTGESKWAKEMFRKKLRRLKDQGMEYLVIDIRNNLGGFGEISYALISLLTNDDLYGIGLGTRKNGDYRCFAEHSIHADGEFSDLRVVALTNCACLSASDETAFDLSQLSNVTLAGITDPCGSGQMTGGCCVLSKGIVTVNFPTGLVLNENGEPKIDPRADRKSRNPVEVRIPLDYEAAMRIFRDREDYELDWAVKFLEDPDKQVAKQMGSQ